ncbi:MAG: hypothetical protein RQ741_14520, partial [Wenzhouxiangellaceae bacterium]|nr:hypothetical protein [Wenzhouxiangellaceae bacterium]
MTSCKASMVATTIATTIATTLAALAPIGNASAADSLEEALAESQWGLDFRHRIELVDEDGLSEDAEASTLRTRLHLKTGRWRG